MFLTCHSLDVNEFEFRRNRSVELHQRETFIITNHPQSTYTNNPANILFYKLYFAQIKWKHGYEFDAVQSADVVTYEMRGKWPHNVL